MKTEKSPRRLMTQVLNRFLYTEQFSIGFDRNYGDGDRTGWTVKLDGVVYAELEEHPLQAIGTTLLKVLDEEISESDLEVG